MRNGMPDVKNIARFIPENTLNDRYSADWTIHASQPFALQDGPFSYRTGLMKKQTKGFWGCVPGDLTDIMKYSQIVQAEAMKYLIELFRAAKWQKTGLIWWNVIDCRPQFSDAVVDYYYVKKLAYYYIRNIQQPVLFIISDPESWCCPLTVSNDSTEDADGTYKVSNLLTGEVFAEGHYAVASGSAVCVTRFGVCQGEQRMLLIEWTDGGKTFYNHYLLGAAPFNFQM